MENIHIISNTQQLQKYVRVNISVLKQSFLPYEFDAQEKYMLPYLGDSLLLELRKLANKEEYPDWADTDQKKNILSSLLDKCSRSLAKFTIYLATPHMDLHLSEMGFVVSNTQHSAPASAHRVQAARSALLESGYDNLETMLKFLEINYKDIDSYKDSDAFVFSFSNLINSAEEFNRILPINQSRLHFLSLKGELNNVKDLTIIPVASKELVNELIQQKKTGSLTKPNEKAVFMIQKAMAHLAAANTISPRSAAIYLNPSSQATDPVSDSTLTNPRGNLPLADLIVRQTKDRLKGVGQAHLAALRKLLTNKPDDYPAFKNSSVYKDSDKSKPFENTESPLFVFGQPSID